MHKRPERSPEPALPYSRTGHPDVTVCPLPVADVGGKPRDIQDLPALVQSLAGGEKKGKREGQEMYLSAALGGVLIGLAAVWLYLSLGRIAGISGIVGQLVRNSSGLWPLGFVIGLGIGGLSVMTQIEPSTRMEIDYGVLAVGGLIVGFGTRLGSGCTSGHGVCGIARFSKRSVVATCVFVATGMITATLLRAMGVLPS